MMQRSFFALSFLLLALTAHAEDVSLAGFLGSKALITIDGSPPQSLAVGQSLRGVKLLSIEGDKAVIEIQGKKRQLRVGQHAQATASASGGEKIVLSADAQGHFMTNGIINGVGSASFIVDTGASMISIGASDAKRLGLDLSAGEKVISNTANGQVETKKITLETIQIGDVTLHRVDALIHKGELPFALLGMSFLNRMEMQRDGQTMVLKKRF